MAKPRAVSRVLIVRACYAFSISGSAVCDTDAKAKSDPMFQVMEPTMISREDGNACLEAEAIDLKAMSYEELEEFARSHSMLNEWQSRKLLVDGVTVYVDTMIGKLGRLRKRISVELILSAEDETQLPNTTGLYFERYRSGRFYPSPREEAREAALLKALPYALLGVVVIALLALVWYLFLRGG